MLNSRQETQKNKKTYKNTPRIIKKMVIGTCILIIILNVNGLNAPTKRNRLAEWIQKQDLNVWFIPGGSDGKESACNAGDLGSIPGLGRSPWEGNGNPFQYSCLEHGQRSLAGYSPRDRKELDMTDQLSTQHTRDLLQT